MLVSLESTGLLRRGCWPLSSKVLGAAAECAVAAATFALGCESSTRGDCGTLGMSWFNCRLGLTLRGLSAPLTCAASTSSTICDRNPPDPPDADLGDLGCEKVVR